MESKQLLVGVWLLLPLASVAGESVRSAVSNKAATSIPASAPQTQSFDLRGGAVRAVVRATAATQASTAHRVEPAKRQEPDLVAALRVEPPAKRPESTSRPPDRPPPCDGFFSCGLETLLGQHDNDFEEERRLARQLKDRLMNQGSFADKSTCDACQAAAAPTPNKTSGPSTELRPDRP